MRAFFALLFQSPGRMVRCRIWSLIRSSLTFPLLQYVTTIGARLSIRLSFLFLCNESLK